MTTPCPPNPTVQRVNMPEQSKLKVFLCHASQDKPIVRDLYQRLSAEGWIDPWLDEEKLLPGQDWDMEIEKAVEATDIVIVFLSNTSVSKEGYIQKELRYALDIALEKPEGAIFIIPVRLDDCVVPRKIKLWQYMDHFPAERFEWAYKKMLDSVKRRAEIVGIDTAYALLEGLANKPIDFGSMDIRRRPIYFLLECGNAMQGEPMLAVEQGVQLLHNEMMGQPQAVEEVYVSVITYSTYAQQIVPLTSIVSFNPPSLAAGGLHNLGNALHFLCDCVSRDRIQNTATAKGDHTPIVFWITAEKPTDKWMDGLEYLKRGAKVNVIALSAGENIDLNILKQVASNILSISTITPDMVRSFFKMISVTVASKPE